MSTSSLPKFVLNEETVIVTVTDRVSGTGRKESNGKNTFCPDFKKYEDGTALEVRFRKLPTGKEMVLGVKPIDTTIDYVVLMQQADFDDVMDFLDNVHHKHYLATTFSSMFPRNLADVLKHSSKNVVLTQSMSYIDAYALYNNIANEKKPIIIKIVPAGEVEMDAVEDDDDNIREEELEWVGTHWVAPSFRPIFKACKKAIEAGISLNIEVLGPSGFGKTQTAKALAHWLGDLPCIRINCATVTTTEEWFGYPEARGGETMFLPTELTEILRKGHAVVILDEYNRIEPWVANSLFPVLDEDRATTVHNEAIILGDCLIFWLTANVGTQYSGTFTVDEAFKNRFDLSVFVTPPPADIERDIITKKYPTLDKVLANRIITVLGNIRSAVDRGNLTVDVSTRTAQKLAKAVSILGMDLRTALENIVINKAQPEEKKAIVDSVNLSIGAGSGMSKDKKFGK